MIDIYDKSMLGNTLNNLPRLNDTSVFINVKKCLFRKKSCKYSKEYKKVRIYVRRYWI